MTHGFSKLGLSPRYMLGLFHEKSYVESKTTTTSKLKIAI